MILVNQAPMSQLDMDNPAHRFTALTSDSRASIR